MTPLNVYQPEESKKKVVFVDFKNTKRIQWNAYRRYEFWIDYKFKNTLSWNLLDKPVANEDLQVFLLPKVFMLKAVITLIAQ